MRAKYQVDGEGMDDKGVWHYQYGELLQTEQQMVDDELWTFHLIFPDGGDEPRWINDYELKEVTE